MLIKISLRLLLVKWINTSIMEDLTFLEMWELFKHSVVWGEDNEQGVVIFKFNFIINLDEISWVRMSSSKTRMITGSKSVAPRCPMIKLFQKIFSAHRKMPVPLHSKVADLCLGLHQRCFIFKLCNTFQNRYYAEHPWMAYSAASNTDNVNSVQIY